MEKKHRNGEKLGVRSFKFWNDFKWKTKKQKNKSIKSIGVVNGKITLLCSIFICDK